MHDVVDPDVLLVGLAEQLHAAAEVAQRPDCVRAAKRDDVALTPGLANFARARAHQRRPISVVGEEMEPRAEQPLELDVAGRLIAWLVPFDGSAEEQLASEPDCEPPPPRFAGNGSTARHPR